MILERQWDKVKKRLKEMKTWERRVLVVLLFATLILIGIIVIHLVWGWREFQSLDGNGRGAFILMGVYICIIIYPLYEKRRNDGYEIVKLIKNKDLESTNKKYFESLLTIFIRYLEKCAPMVLFALLFLWERANGINSDSVKNASYLSLYWQLFTLGLLINVFIGTLQSNFLLLRTNRFIEKRTEMIRKGMGKEEIDSLC